MLHGPRRSRRPPAAPGRGGAALQRGAAPAPNGGGTDAGHGGAAAWGFGGWFGNYPLVNVYIAIENGHRNSGFSH